MTDSRFISCINRIRAGDKNGLRDIYGEYGKLIYSTMLSVSKNPHDAEDLTSDYFIRFWEKLAETFRSGSGHKKWLTITARNMAVDSLRKRSHEIAVLDEDEGEELPSRDDTEGTVIGNITACEALENLTESEREILDMKVLRGLTLSEIALILKKPVGTVAWRYRQASEKLRKNIEGGAAL